MGPEALAGFDAASPINHGWLMDVLNWLTTIGLAVFIWTSQRRQATRDQIKELDNDVRNRSERLEKKISEEVRDIHKRVSSETRKMDNRLTSLEEWRKTVPGTVDVQKLYTELATVRGDVREINSGLKSISGSVGGVQRSISLINEHLLQQDKQLSRTTGETNDG